MNAYERAAVAILADALQSGTAAYWLRRAEAIERCRPVPGEFTGAASPQDLSARWQRLTQIAQACRARAHVAATHDDYEAEVMAAWEAVA